MLHEQKFKNVSQKGTEKELKDDMKEEQSGTAGVSRTEERERRQKEPHKRVEEGRRKELKDDMKEEQNGTCWGVKDGRKGEKAKETHTKVKEGSYRVVTRPALITGLDFIALAEPHTIMRWPASLWEAHFCFVEKKRRQKEGRKEGVARKDGRKERRKERRPERRVTPREERSKEVTGGTEGNTERRETRNSGVEEKKGRKRKGILKCGILREVRCRVSTKFGLKTNAQRGGEGKQRLFAYVIMRWRGTFIAQSTNVPLFSRFQRIYRARPILLPPSLPPSFSPSLPPSLLLSLPPSLPPSPVNVRCLSMTFVHLAQVFRSGREGKQDFLQSTDRQLDYSRDHGLRKCRQAMMKMSPPVLVLVVSFDAALFSGW
jgi:hypothetical protein